MSGLETLRANVAFKNAAWTADAGADVYAANTASTTDFTHFVTRAYLSHLTTRIPAGARVLDLGCGTGVLTTALAAQGYDVTGVDISAAMLRRIRPASPGDRIRLLQGDVFDLPCGDAEFDGVITRWVVPHFRNWPDIVRQAARVLRPGGILVFDHTNREHYALATREHALDWRRFGYDPRPDGEADAFYAAASPEDLRMAADLAGLELIGVEPQSFFRQNAVIAAAVGGDGFQIYKNAIDHFWQEPSVQAFMQWFELNVTPTLPLAMTNGVTVVLRKPIDTGR